MSRQDKDRHATLPGSAPPAVRESWFDDLDGTEPKTTSPAVLNALAPDVASRIDMLARAVRLDAYATHRSLMQGSAAEARRTIAEIIAAAEQILAICASVDTK